MIYFSRSMVCFSGCLHRPSFSELLVCHCIRALLVLFLCFNSSAISQTENEKSSLTEIVNRLNAIWDQQRTALKSGTFHCRVYHHRVREGGISRKQVRESLNRLSKDLSPQALLEVGFTLAPKLRASNISWSDKIYTFDGDSYKVHETLPGSGGLSRTHVVQKGHEIATWPGGAGRPNQINIANRGTLPMHTISLGDLVFVPPEGLVDETWKVVADSATDDESHVIKLSRVGSDGQTVTMIVDKVSGFVHEYSAQSSARPSQYHELLQFNPMAFEQGIILPEIRLKARYRNEKLGSFELRVIDEAIPNAQLPDSEFHIAVGEENLVVDLTTFKPERVLNHPRVDDATKLIGYAQSVSDESSRFPATRLSITAILAILLFIAVLLKHKRNKISAYKA